MSVPETIPTDNVKNNPEMDFTYDVDGNLTQIDMTINTRLFRKTLTWTDGELTNVSKWSEVTS